MIDIGANLADKSFASDREQVIDRAIEAGVGRLILTGSTVSDSERALEIARGRPGVLYSTAGVHPHHAKDCDKDTIPALRRLAGAPEVVAVGECGLDFYRDLSPRPVQIEAMIAQTELAIELEMPLFLHERDAHDALVEVIRPRRDRLVRAVVHCFTGGERELRAYLDLDLYIGITGWICDERRGNHLRDLVGLIPPDRLMIETDAPYLMPRTIRPRPKTRRNEPCNLGYVLDAVAESVGVPAAQVAKTTTRTAEEFFGLAE